MYRTTVVSATSVTSTAGIQVTAAGYIGIFWSRTLIGVVSEGPLAAEITCCGAMI
jgi:hypothetical protein